MSENKYLDYMEMPSIEQKQRNMFDVMTEGIALWSSACLAHVRAWGKERRKGGREEEYEKGGTFVKGMAIERLGTCGTGTRT